MKDIVRSLLFLLCFIFLFGSKLMAFEVVSSASSPDEKIKAELMLRNDSLFYQVYKENTLVINPSNLGISIFGGVFLSGLAFDKSEKKEYNETYTLPSGKKSVYVNHYNELTTTFKRNNSQLNVIFRLYNDGVAFRYNINNTGISTTNSETSEVNVASFQYSWVQKYHSDYSWYYEKRDWASNAAQRELNTPCLVQANGNYLLITEAANYGNYATSKLIADTKYGNYYFEPVGKSKLTFPFETPWRTILIGSLATIIESHTIENLNPPTEIADISWIKPGRVSWDWGGEDARNTVGLDIAKRYIDLASYMGWEYFNLDDGWDSSHADYTLQDIVNYANQKNVGVILWTNHNRFQNDSQDMRNKLSPWKDMGIKGIKIDFWEDDAQEMMQKYDKFLEVTADLELLVNLHGCTKPSGIRRRWPHLLTSEAVLGGEFYFQEHEHMVHAAHNISLVMTRNVIGPMDYTPCDFAMKNGKIKQVTSWAHQLALTTAYESGFQYMADAPQNYKYHIAESFLKNFPVAWDDIKCIEAKPDSFVTIARRAGADWYVSTLANKKRTLKLDLSFLEAGKTYYAYIYKDGTCMSDIEFEYRPDVKQQDNIELAVLKSGGATVYLTDSPTMPMPGVKLYEAENSVTNGTKRLDGDGLCSGNRYVTNLGEDKTVEFQDVTVDKAGEYALGIYYMCAGDKSAYVKVNNGDDLYHNFSGSEGETGKYLAFKTTVVSLKEGTNTIRIGSSESCPNIDRITIKNLIDTVPDQPVNSLPGFKEQYKWFFRDGVLTVHSDYSAEYLIFDMEGRIIQRNRLHAGKNEISIPGHCRAMIVNINNGIESYSFKIIK